MTLAQAAVTLVGTPFKWHGRVPGVGIDCSGVIVCSMQIAGMQVPEEPRYGKADNLQMGLGWLDRVFDRVSGNDILFASDILVFELESGCFHCGIMVSSTEFVHSDSRLDFQKVVRHPVHPYLEHIARVYRVKGS